MNSIPSKELRRYFKKGASWPKSILLILVGGTIFFVPYSQNYLNKSTLPILGILLALIGFIRLLFISGSRLRDQDVDNHFQNCKDEIAKVALNKLGLDETELLEKRKEPILITGPILWPTTGVNREDLLWKKGKDNIVRFAINRVTVIYFSQNLLASYACDFNFLKNVSLNEKTDEYYYKDIVSVSTSENSSSHTLPNGVKLTHSQEFRLSISSGEAISVIISAGKLSKFTGGTIPTTEAEKGIQIIRKMLKEKKQ